MQQWLFKLGIKTFTDTYYTQLVGDTGVKIGQDMPNPIGWIYGISIETDCTQPTDQTKLCISLSNASQLYLYFKVGTDLFINNFRIDRAVYTVPVGVPTPAQYQNQERYFPVNIPRVTDLKQSYYNNPTGIGTPLAPVYIPLTVYYIDVTSYNHLVKMGHLFDGAAAVPAHPLHSKHLPPGQHKSAI